MQQAPFVTDPRFDPPGDEPEYTESQRRRSWFGSCLIGCGIFLALAIVLGLIAFGWLLTNWRGLAAKAGASIAHQQIDASALDAEEKSELKVQVNRVSEAFREGRLTERQVGEIFERLVESPLMTSLMATAAERQYFANSGLSEEEKAEGRRNIQRFVRGIIDDKIDEAQMNSVLMYIADRQEDGEWRLRQKVSDEDLRKFIAAAGEAADVAEVPPELPAIDPSDEVKKIIDGVMFPGAEDVEGIALPPVVDGDEAEVPLEEEGTAEDEGPVAAPRTDQELDAPGEPSTPAEGETPEN